MEKITFMPEGGEAVEFFVLEQTTIGGAKRTGCGVRPSL